MRLSVFLASVVGVLLLGAATIYGAIVLDDRLQTDPSLIEVLVATDDIPACTDSEGWANSMEVVRLRISDVPPGALVDTSVVSRQVLVRDVATGDVIRVQLFGKASECPVPSG